MTNAMVSKRVGCQFLLLCLTVLLMAGLCFGQPSVGLTHIVGPPTTTVFVSGNGFAANAAIDIYFETADLALAVTNGTGAFSSIRIQVPAAARPGKHWVTAVTRSTGAAGQKAFLVRTNWAEFGFTPNGKRFNHFEN